MSWRPPSIDARFKLEVERPTSISNVTRNVNLGIEGAMEYETEVAAVARREARIYVGTNLIHQKFTKIAKNIRISISDSSLSAVSKRNSAAKDSCFSLFKS